MYHKEVACHFIGVGGVVIYNSKILLVKLSYGPSKGKWLIPGGMVNCGETMTEALIREIKEESNQDVIPKSIIGIRSMVRKGENLTDVYFIFNCGIQGVPKPIIKDEKEVNDVAWIRLSDLDNDLDIPDYTKYIIYHAFSKRNFLKIDNHWNAERLKSGRFLKYEHFL